MYITKKPRLWGDVAIFIWSTYFVVVVVHDEAGGLLSLDWRSTVVTVLILLGGVAIMFVSARSILRYRSRRHRYETYKEDVKQHLAIKRQLIAKINCHFESLHVYPSSKYEFSIPDQAHVYVTKINWGYMCSVTSVEGVVYNPTTMRDDSVEAVRIYTIPIRSKDDVVCIEYDGAIVADSDDDDEEPIVNWFVGEDGGSFDHEAIGTASVAELEELFDLLMQTQ